MTAVRPPLKPTRRDRPLHTQSGVAAIELAVSMLLLMMIFFAIISYGTLFWAQQKLSQLAGEGARFALMSSYQGVPPENTTSDACAHLQMLAAQDTLINAMGEASFKCMPDPPAQAACIIAGFTCAALRLSLDVKGWPLLNIMRTLARVFTDGSLIPDTLHAHSTIQIASGVATP